MQAEAFWAALMARGLTVDTLDDVLLKLSPPRVVDAVLKKLLLDSDAQPKLAARVLCATVIRACKIAFGTTDTTQVCARAWQM